MSFTRACVVPATSGCWFSWLSFQGDSLCPAVPCRCTNALRYSAVLWKNLLVLPMPCLSLRHPRGATGRKAAELFACVNSVLHRSVGGAGVQKGVVLLWIWVGAASCCRTLVSSQEMTALKFIWSGPVCFSAYISEKGTTEFAACQVCCLCVCKSPKFCL